MSYVIPRPQALNVTPDWGLPADRIAVPASQVAPRVLRRWAARALAASRRPHSASIALADSLSLVISELAANSVEHSASADGGTVLAELYLPTDALGLRVIDQGPRSGPAPGTRCGPVAPPLCLDGADLFASERGRGLALIALYSRRYGWTAPPEHDGYSVWCELDITATGPEAA